MNKVLENVEPREVFSYFEEICGIPHVSHHTEQIADYLTTFAVNHNLRYIKDELGNVIIFKDASAGYEDHDAVILQGHMDMVGAKEEGSSHDFLTDPIVLLQETVKDGYITADGTTLGGDDGIAVAYMLAILADKSLSHPAIEAVFTVDEEVGLLGATGIDCSPLKGKVLLNLDSEDEGIFLAGSAGGMGCNLTLPVRRTKSEGTGVEIVISGLNGGHSGISIGTGRPSANILMGRVLYTLSEELNYELEALKGGEVDNAIANKCVAKLVMDKECIEAVYNVCHRLQDTLRFEYRGIDDEITISVNEGDQGEYDTVDPVSREKIVFLLRQMPYGVQARNCENVSFVETSLNQGVIKLRDDEFYVGISVRSSMESAKHDLADRLRYLVEFIGGDCEIEGDYPGWSYNADSRVRPLICETYKELFGKEPKTEIIHAGLECGIFYDKIPGLDIVSYGPDMEAIHTHEEKLYIDSVKRVYELTVKLLEKL